MSNKRDYYEVLGVSRSASESELKRAYRKTALESHPDQNPGDDEAAQRFKEAAEAYKVLSDAQQRRVYDQFGHAGLEQRGFSGFSSMEDIFGGLGSDFFGSVLGDLFGFGGRRGSGGPRPEKGASLKMRVPLTFEESFTGIEKRLRPRTEELCPDCDGTGAAPGGMSACKDCGGSGQRLSQTGFMTVSIPCRRCGGSGHTIEKRCDRCKGKGGIPTDRVIPVTIPPGVNSGDSMRISGEGEPGRHGGPAGDLFLVFEVGDHPTLKRDGTGLHLDVQVSFLQAILGGSVTVSNVDGPLQVDVAPGTQPGDSIRFRRRGMPDPNSGHRGDLFAHIQVTIPRKLDRHQKKALEELLPLF